MPDGHAFGDADLMAKLHAEAARVAGESEGQRIAGQALASAAGLRPEDREAHALETARRLSDAVRNDRFRILRERVWKFAASRVGTAGADDVASEAIGRLIRRYPNVTELEDMIPLTIKIATNVIYHAWRDKTKAARHESIDELDYRADHVSQEEHSHWRGLADRVIGILRSKRVKPRCMKLFQMIYEGYDFEQIRQQMGEQNKQVIFNWVFRCRKQIFDELGGSPFPSGGPT